MGPRTTISETARRPPEPEDAEGFGQDRPLVRRLVDDAVGDDHVDVRVGERQVLDLPLPEFHVLDAGLPGIRACLLEHLVGHVHAVHHAFRADPTGRKKRVGSGTRAEVQHRLASLEIHQGRGVAASEGCFECRSRQLFPIVLGVQPRGDGISGLAVRGAASPAPLLGRLPSRLTVFLAEPFPHLRGRRGPVRVRPGTPCPVASIVHRITLPRSVTLKRSVPQRRFRECPGSR